MEKLSRIFKKRKVLICWIVQETVNEKIYRFFSGSTVLTSHYMHQSFKTRPKIAGKPNIFIINKKIKDIFTKYCKIHLINFKQIYCKLAFSYFWCNLVAEKMSPLGTNQNFQVLGMFTKFIVMITSSCKWTKLVHYISYMVLSIISQ